MVLPSGNPGHAKSRTNIPKPRAEHLHHFGILLLVKYELLEARAFDPSQKCDIKLVLYDLDGTKLEVNWMESSNNNRAWQMRLVPLEDLKK